MLPIGTGASTQLSLQADGSGTNVVIDVTGYNVAPLYADVSGSGTLIKGSRTTGVSDLGTGIYEVDFVRNVASCSYAANSYVGNVTVLTEPRAGNVDGVFLVTEQSGTATDAEFWLTLTC